MDIIFSCGCGRRLHAKENHSGRRARCPACGEISIVPPPAPPAPQPGQQESAPKDVAVADMVAGDVQDTYRLEPTPAWATPEAPGERVPWTTLALDDDG